MNPYDEVLYPTHAFSQTHPDRLATLARLYGMTPAAPRRSRVLELGCGSGGNLIPMAAQLPESEFVGVDLAARPIADGQLLIEEAGLRNVALRCEDISDFPADAGLFDYVIAHGVYSWVPAEVRDRLLAVARAHLAPDGVAFVSYNAYPGGHVRTMLREMMFFHVRGIEDPYRRLNQALALLKFLSDSQTATTPYALMLKAEVERILKLPLEHLYHDDLEETNEHVYFTQFAEHAARHGLQYISEADYHRTHSRWHPTETVDPLASLDDTPLLKEQYGDFLHCRRFRQTLLCHEGIEIDREQRPEQMRQFHFAARSYPDSTDVDVRSDAAQKFLGMNDVTLEVGFPLAKAAFQRLGEHWPRSVAFDELLDDSRSLLARNDDSHDASRSVAREEDAADLCRVLLGAYATGFLEAHAYAPDFVTVPGERPRTTPLARAQAQRGTLVSNLRHVNLQIDDALGRRLIQLLDGTRDRAALLSELKIFVESGEATKREGEIDDDARQLLRSLPDELEANLSRLASYALLVS
jgi:SAM-dependent methyltransferase